MQFKSVDIQWFKLLMQVIESMIHPTQLNKKIWSHSLGRYYVLKRSLIWSFFLLFRSKVVYEFENCDSNNEHNNNNSSSNDDGDDDDDDDHPNGF